MTQPLTDQQLAGIEARAAAATPGLWTVEWDEDDVSDAPFPVSIGPIGYVEHHGERAVPDAQFVEHAHNDVTAMAAEIHRLRALLARDHHVAYHQGEPPGNHVRCSHDHCPTPAARPSA